MSEQKKSEYLRYLPAVFQEDPFLGRFLVPFEEVLNGFGDLLSDIDHYFTPALTEPDFLPWLAQWLAMTLDEEWEDIVFQLTLIIWCIKRKSLGIIHR